jgi:hypothetical protein
MKRGTRSEAANCRPINTKVNIDECMDVPLLLALIRYKPVVEINEYFMFCQLLPTRNTGEDIFNRLNDFITGNEIRWSECMAVNADGAPAVSELYSFRHSCCHIIRQMMYV